MNSQYLSSRMSDELVQRLKTTVHHQVIDKLLSNEQRSLVHENVEFQTQIKSFVQTCLEREIQRDEYILLRNKKNQIIEELLNEILGLGVLELFIQDKTITEIMVNGAQQVFIEKNGKLILSNVHFQDDSHLMRIIRRILTPLGRRIDESSPYVDARLADGSRVNVIIPPLAIEKPYLTIRKFFKQNISIDELIKFGTLSKNMGIFLEACVRARLNILISGGSGAGKTTTLNVLSSFIPETERIITIEDVAELNLQQKHLVKLEARPANLEGSGEVTVRDLVKNALRMRPDRIIVGEVRSGEALDMLQAMNTGHDGSLTTIHANSPRDVLNRLETMVLMSGIDLPIHSIENQILSAIDLMLHVSRFRDGTRKITHITEVIDIKNSRLVTRDIFRYVQDYVDKDGKFIGHYENTNTQLSYKEKFQMNGIDLPASFFESEK